jgi:hypothetical protein
MSDSNNPREKDAHEADATVIGPSAEQQTKKDDADPGSTIAG